MKVLHIYRTCFPETRGGVEQVIRYICKGTQNLGVTSKILALSQDESKKIRIEGTELILCKSNFEIASNNFSFELIREYKKLSQWADIVHFHYPWPSGDLLLLLFNRSHKTIVTYHSDIIRQKWLHRFYYPLEQFFLKKVNKIIATSPQYQKSSPNLIKYSPKVSVIPLCVDEQDYSAVNTKLKEEWRQAIGAEGFFLFVGVLRYYKGLTYLLEAAREVDAKIVIAGKGPQEQELADIMSNHNIHNVHLIGYITEEDKIALLSLCKAFVFPSHLRSEAFGVSLLEAQAMSKALITCDIGTGSSYVNIDGQTGLVVPPSNSIALANAMNSIKQENASEFGKAGYIRFQQLFTLKTQGRLYHSVYKELLLDK